ncbi:micrococcal nuclease [Malonomonas rubra DSM 5091]|uniref:Micrococcal nuclease n=1 Tax=Malonomonas rubra DSM 5091 TaxID=1122189 RepID=A0A1M6GPU0_MALRU|nr:thermonuclease family protein [Malonomonas rubra]SHJ11997.1 micrococcal nuclease [Malonomonas rubra DSM 5091]
MIRLCLILISCLLLALPVFADEASGVVSWIYDGDSLKVDKIGKVRLLGIDTPESKASGRDHYYTSRYNLAPGMLRQIAYQAKKFNIDQVKGKRVTLVFEQQKQDKYQRKLAYLYLPDGRMLNLLLLQKGLASTFRKYRFGEKEKFLAAEQSAREKKLGLWQNE